MIKGSDILAPQSKRIKGSEMLAPREQDDEMDKNQTVVNA